MHCRIVDGIRRCVGRRHQSIPTLDPLEVRVEALGWWQPMKRCFFEEERVMQEPSRSRCIDHEPRLDSHRTAVALALEDHARSLLVDPLQPGHVQIDGTFGLSLLCKGLIELRTVPVGIGDLVMRACGNQQLSLVIAVFPQSRARP